MIAGQTKEVPKAKSEKEKRHVFQMEDLNPRSCDLQIEVNGQVKTYHLRKFNLLAQLWTKREWGSEKASKEAFDPTSEINLNSGMAYYHEAILKLLHFLLEDKTDFPTWEDFATCIGAGPVEIMNVERVYLTVIGMSQPIIDEAMETLKKKVRAQMSKLGGT